MNISEQLPPVLMILVRTCNFLPFFPHLTDLQMVSPTDPHNGRELHFYFMGRVAYRIFVDACPHAHLTCSMYHYLQERQRLGLSGLELRPMMFQL